MNHFLDIHKTDPAALRTILDDALAMKSARKGLPRATLDAEKAPGWAYGCANL